MFFICFIILIVDVFVRNIYLFTFFCSEYFTSLTATSYDAVIVDFIEHYDEEDGVMYTSIVEFTPENSNVKNTKRLNYSSEGVPQIGSVEKITYKNGKVVSKSFPTVMLYFIGLLFSLISFSFVFLGLSYALYIDLPIDLIRF